MSPFTVSKIAGHTSVNMTNYYTTSGTGLCGKKNLENFAAKYGMTVRPCAEGNDLAAYGADCSGCMTVATFEKALHNRLEIPKRKINQRNGACACVLGVDIAHMIHVDIYANIVMPMQM